MHVWIGEDVDTWHPVSERMTHPLSGERQAGQGTGQGGEPKASW